MRLWLLLRRDWAWVMIDRISIHGRFAISHLDNDLHGISIKILQTRYLMHSCEVL